MDDHEFAYQTYLITFATASVLFQTRNQSGLSLLVDDVEHRAGLERRASRLALKDASGDRGEIRSRAEVIGAVGGNTSVFTA